MVSIQGSELVFRNMHSLDPDYTIFLLLYTYYETAYLIGRAAVTWDKIENDYSTTF